MTGAIYDALNEHRLSREETFKIKSTMRWVVKFRSSQVTDEALEGGLLLRHVVDNANSQDWEVVAKELKLEIASLPFQNNENGTLSLDEIFARVDQSLAYACRTRLVKDEACPRHPDTLEVAEVALVADAQQLRALLRHVLNHWQNR
ncbi:MAG: hypothetical protein DI628_05270 [Blastochloris viridis]|uniref:Uncharacterized protein n=1 Tax=Blastochloris viridis TaxID=1079 RepID=A0A6N4RAX2_BLAVI|nr:MAG: hypothetical protein DI628_05270 [Blastochloris viridis]